MSITKVIVAAQLYSTTVIVGGGKVVVGATVTMVVGCNDVDVDEAG